MNRKNREDRSESQVELIELPNTIDDSDAGNDLEKASMLRPEVENQKYSTSCIHMLSILFFHFRLFEILFIWGLYQTMDMSGFKYFPALNFQYIPSV